MTTIEPPGLSRLTPEQQRAVRGNTPLMLVLAGPGSGKTEVLSKRVLRLLADGVPPADIVVVTFTNAGAIALRERLGGVELRHIGTLHAFLLGELQTHGAALGYSEKLTVLDFDHPRKLPKDAADYKAGTLLLDDLRRASSPKVTLSKLLKAMNGQAELTAADIRAGGRATLAAFEGACRRESCVTFEMILRDGLKIVDKIAPCRHLLVDEFQDSAALDWQFYQAMRAASKFFVGDPDQQIFSFRGGSIDGIMELAHNPLCDVVKLEKNFRSDHAICQAAQRLIEHNTGRVAKDTIAVSDLPGRVLGGAFPSHEDEAGQIIQQVRQWIGFVPSVVAERGALIGAMEIAVLARNNAECAFIAERLKNAGVPVCERDVNVVDNNLRLRAALQVMAAPSDMAVAEFLRRDGKAARLADLRQAAKLARRPLREVMNDPRVNRQPLELWGDDLLNHLARIGLTVAEVSAAREAMDALATPGMAGLVMSLYAPEAREVGQGVTVTTFHGAKGREWDHVWLMACEDALVPGHRVDTDIEEARRLFYVACTRARHGLMVSWSRTRPTPWGDWQSVEHRPSRFLAEAGI